MKWSLTIQNERVTKIHGKMSQNFIEKYLEIDVELDSELLNHNNVDKFATYLV